MPSSPWAQPDYSTRPIAMIGSGIMGRRVIMMLVAAGYNVILCEKSMGSYDGALDYVNDNKGQQAAKLDTKPGEIRLTASLQEATHNAWMAIEAIPEKLEMKIDIKGQVDKLAPSDCVVTTNSSSLRSSPMFVNTVNNYRICNGHYYMPPDQTYYEVMCCGHTDPAIFRFLMDVAASAGFQPVHVK